MKVFVATDRGKVRDINEDSGAFVPPHTCVVADGMGGYAAGEVASRMLVETFKARFSTQTDKLGEESLRRAVLEANRKILQTSAENSEYRGMGTTVVALQWDEQQAYWAHVGDSRLYLLRAGEFKRITHDHSFVQSLVDKGTITEIEAEHHPKKNMLTRAVGVEENLIVDTGSFAVKAEDIFLLCSDGLTNMVEEAAIREALQEGSADKAQHLVRLAIQAGGFDNITAIVAEDYGA